MSIVDGFRQGFGMMNDYYNQQDRRDYNRAQLGLQNRRMNMAEESHNANMETAGLRRTLLQGQVDDMPAATKHRNTMRGLEVRGQQLSVDGQETQNAINDFNLSSAKTNASNKAKDRKRTEALERYKVYASTGDWASFIQDPSFRDTDLELLQNPEGAEAAVALTKGIESGDINTVVNESNRLFKSKLNRNVGKMKGRDGGTIRDITIVDFAQQQDGSIKVPVRVTTDKGTYTSYISEMRGIDPNDPEKVFTADDLYGKAAAMGQLGAVLKSSGVYKKFEDSAQNYLTPQSGKGNGIPAKVQEMEYTRRLLGDEQYKQWLMFGRGKSPQELSMAAYKLASDTLDGVYFDTPEEKKAAVDKMTGELVSQFSQPTQSGTPQPQPNPAPNPSQHSQLIQQAAEAIQNGKDRNAVIQRLVEMGVPQDQINL